MDAQVMIIYILNNISFHPAIVLFEKENCIDWMFVGKA
jgi:hypothetical protein